MDNLKLKQTCLLDASGELTPAARKEFIKHISQDPEAYQQYESTYGAFALLGLLPIPEPSAHERRAIPAQIKKAIHAAMAGPVKQARRARMLIRYAALTALLAAGGAIFWAVWTNGMETDRSLDQIARIHAATERALPAGHASAYEQALTDVRASIRQLEMESPTLSNVYDKDLGNLLDALASVPQVYGSTAESGEGWPGW